jgi:N-acetylglucosamine-6-phosphate deacetylase
VPFHAIFAGCVFTPDHEIHDAVILLDGEKVAAVGRRDEVTVPESAKRYDKREFSVIPGFIDVHIHGAAGHDVMESRPQALATITRFVVRHGTTSVVATTVTASEESICKAAENVADWIESGRVRMATEEPTAEILGVHFEGPFISPHRRGVHPKEWIAPPSPALFSRFLAAAKGAARIVTLAPELPGADEIIAQGVRAGLVVSIGHTDAKYAEALKAISLGARHAAHVFNAMRPFSHRETGVVGAVLTSPAVTAELIADGVHVDDAAIRVLFATKGAAGVVLVSDGTAATGMLDGKYRLGTFEVNVVGGVARNSEDKLAGSTLTLDRALRHMLALGFPLRDVLPMLTSNPARLLGIEQRKGALVVGADADLVFLDDQFQIAGVVTRGRGLD